MFPIANSTVLSARPRLVLPGFEIIQSFSSLGRTFRPVEIYQFYLHPPNPGIELFKWSSKAVVSLLDVLVT